MTDENGVMEATLTVVLALLGLLGGAAGWCFSHILREQQKDVDRMDRRVDTVEKRQDTLEKRFVHHTDCDKRTQEMIKSDKILHQRMNGIEAVNKDMAHTLAKVAWDVEKEKD